MELANSASVIGLTTAELEAASGLSRPSVAALVERFRPFLEVQDADGNPSRESGYGGYGRRLTIDARAGVVFGVDVGDEITRVAIGDLYGRISDVVHIGAPEDAFATIERVAQSVLELLGGRPVTDVVGVGISLAAPVDGEGGFAWRGPSGSRWSGRWDEWQLMRVREELQRRLGWSQTPFMRDNNANLGALAESIWGIGRRSASAEAQHSNIVYVEWSRRIATGLMLGGGLYRGGGLAGELGHLVVRSDENVPVCERCGNRGCLETVAGWDAVLRSLGRPATQRDLEEALYLAAYPGNIERDAFESAASEVGRALGQLVTLLNPDIVIIGGDVGKSGFDVIRGPLLMSMRRHTIQPALADLTVLPPALQQNAALHGAIGLILRGDGSSSTLASYFQRSTADIRG